MQATSTDLVLFVLLLFRSVAIGQDKLGRIHNGEHKIRQGGKTNIKHAHACAGRAEALLRLTRHGSGN